MRSASFANRLQLERKPFAFVAKPALAGLFALLLLISATLAVSPAHRQSHNSDRPSKGHECVLCLFAHGHVAAADVAPPSIRMAVISVGNLSLDKHTFPATIDYLLSPSRAPPSVISSSMVVG
jgi:hypothetical protein